MSIRKRDVHFSDWTKVRHALVCNNVQGITEASSFDDVRTFLINSESGSNPFYYYVCYIKDTKEIYTHGQFYDCSGYDDTLINERISEIEESMNLKADLSLVNELIDEVEENETVAAKALTDLNNKKADRTEIPDVSSFALKSDLEVLRQTTESKVSCDDLATINGKSLCGNDITIETPDHYSNTPSSTGSGFVSDVTYTSSGHVNIVTKRAITDSDISSISASKLTGTISLDNLPAGALERMYITSSETTAMSLNIQDGDVVQVTGNSNKMYFCVDSTKTTFATKFKEFTAGSATSVPWSGVTDKPDLATQSELDAVDAKFANYLLLEGGTLTGNLKIEGASNPLINLKRGSDSARYVQAVSTGLRVGVGGSTTNLLIQDDGICKAVDFQTTSDARLKDFQEDVEVDFENLKAIPKKYYYWNDKSMGEELQIGTSAQELAKIYPTCVSYDKDQDRYSVNYQKLSIVALAAIDKLYDEIQELKNIINNK